MDDKKMAKDAILVQDACNLSGVVISFQRVLHELHDRGLSTTEINTHPLSVMYASKIDSLTGRDFSRAYDWCEEKQDGK